MNTMDGKINLSTSLGKNLPSSVCQACAVTFNRPLKKCRETKHRQSPTSQNGPQAISQRLARGAPKNGRPFCEINHKLDILNAKTICPLANCT